MEGGGAVRSQDIADLTAKLLVEYYDNNIEPFLNTCHEDVLWIGPAQGQTIRGQKALREAFAAETQDLRFAVHDLVVLPLYTGSSRVFEVVLMFMVDTFWPDGRSNRVDQRISFTWVTQDGQPRIRLCHISDAIGYDSRDNIYPVHYLDSYENPEPATMNKTDRLFFRGTNKAVFYLDLENVLYAESAGNHTILHTVDHSFESVETLTSIGRRYGRNFLRCHESYLVNPKHVLEVRRFKLRLSDGTQLPVPEKKFTAVRAQLVLMTHGNVK